MKEPAIGMIEFKSIAKGLVSMDAMVKKASVKILESHPICPGKYMTLFCGEVAEVEEALQTGRETGQDSIIDDLFIPYLHSDVIPALTGTTQITQFNSLGIVETFSVPSCIKAADKSAKATPIDLVEIRLANGLGGKGYYIMSGRLFDIEESIKMAMDLVKEDGLIASTEIIPAPHKEFIEKAIYW